MKSVVRKVMGVVFLTLGVAGLVLPVLQGWLFIFIGLSLFSPNLSARVRRKIFLRFAKAPLVGLDEWNRFGVRAGWSTKKFPVHLASTEDLDREEARAAVRSLWDSDSRPSGFAYLKQVHGGHCMRVRRADFGSGGFWRAGAADALVTTEPRIALLVLSADCLPIFFAALRNGKAVAAAVAHAGWRGTKERVAVETLDRLKEISGAPADQIRVAFGPSIDAAHYEVGPEFKMLFPPESLRERNGRLCFDLAGENRRQLIEAGVLKEHLLETGLSTVAENRLFPSFRLEKDAAGRTLSAIFVV